MRHAVFRFRAVSRHQSNCNAQTFTGLSCVSHPKLRCVKVPAATVTQTESSQAYRLAFPQFTFFTLVEAMMTSKRYLSAIAGAALFLAAATGSAGEFLVTNSLPTAETLPAPQVEFMVWDGTTTTTIAGCSEPTCFGWADGTDPTPGTGYVTHAKNNIGWAVSGGTSKGSVYLSVDGQKAASARPGRLLVWSATMGTHSLQVMTFNADGVAGWSPTVTISRQ